MKRLACSALCACAFVRAASGLPVTFYVNDGIVTSTNPPVIDALNFINNNLFQVSSALPYRTYDTINFTNRGIMNGFPGFDFETFPASRGQSRMAKNFFNKASGLSGGQIQCSGFNSLSLIANVGLLTANLGSLTGSSQFIVAATNIINSGTVTMDASSLIRLKGKTIDLSRGTLQMNNSITLLGGIGTNIFFNLINEAGLDGYWGVGTTNFSGPLNMLNLFPNPLTITPAHWVTNRNGTRLLTQLLLNNATAYVGDSGPVNSNRFIQAVFLSNSNTAFANKVFLDPFTPSEIDVQWQWVTTDLATGVPTTNYMVLADTFGEITNLQVGVHGFVGSRLTYEPVNYLLYFQNFDLESFGFPASPPASPLQLANAFPNIPATNNYAAYQAILSPATQFPSDQVLGDVTNLAGRIELSADQSLNLNMANVSALNSLLLRATNHYAGNKGARITAPYYQINLRSTNGVLTLTNLVPGSLPTPQGVCNMWSARWTNVVNSITNRYHVLVVDGEMAPTAIPLVRDLTLVATNLFISDSLNVMYDVLLNAERITLTTNAANAGSREGALNLLNPTILWPNTTPRLQYLTNWGAISTLNAAYFGGKRSSPFFNRNFIEPYSAFVNHGGITNQGCQIWSRYFLNDGTIQCGVGPISLASSDSLLSNGKFLAINNDVSITANNLFVSNHIIQSGGALSLWVTNSMTDGGGKTNGNIWTAADGFNLFRRSLTGDLLGTTVFNFAPNLAQTFNYWAGEDRGAVNDGFLNNAAVGRLVLVAGTNSSSFRFIGTGTAYAALSGDQVVPPVGSPGVGTLRAIISPDGRTISVNLSFSGLSSPATSAHIHGPAAVGADAAPLLTLSGVPAVKSGSVPAQSFALTPTLLGYLYSGLLYVDISTQQYPTRQFPGGEIRGQIRCNALYVNSLEFQGFSYDPDQQNVPTLEIDPNMRIYFGQALANGVPVSIKINGMNDGRLVWVSSYTGPFSSKSLVELPHGSLGSSGSNGKDAVDDSSTSAGGAARIPSDTKVVLSVSVTHSPVPSALVSWNTYPNTTNYVYSSSSLTKDWQLLTNFVYNGPIGPVTIEDPIKPGSPRFYRVRVDAAP